ncbi:MAG TPA: helix-turn-helix domain-containing protein [Solirubrobacteraceae bacterium]|nr:helix-turn-helix domain-containing protein [Solirubrobacteraceae bacterium]
MASVDSLTDEQRAVLQLLLRQGKSYEDIAALLKSEPSKIRARARGAVAAIGPDPGDIESERRDEVADYLLGQQTASQRAATREYLEGSAPGRSWGRAAATALAPLGGDSLPDIPAEREEVAEAFDALDRRTARQEQVKKSSQLGTKLLLGGVGVIVGIAVILALKLGDGGESPSTAATTTTATATTPANVQTTPTGDKFSVVAQGSLAPPQGVKSGAKGQVAIVVFPDNNQYRFALTATGLPASRKNSAYGIWLYTSDEKKQFLGFPDTKVGNDGKLQTVSDLSPETPAYGAVLLTRETADKPAKPGAVVLIARMVTAAKAQQQQQTQTTTTP